MPVTRRTADTTDALGLRGVDTSTDPVAAFRKAGVANGPQ